MKITKLAELLLPILFPSWRFFSSVGPSPRIDFGVVNHQNAEPQTWLPYSPLPKKRGFWGGLQHLFLNSEWNERLYVNTCAQHLIEGDSAFREREIAMRVVASALNEGRLVVGVHQFLVFRIRVLESDAGQLRDDVVFVSKPVPLTAVEVNK